MKKFILGLSICLLFSGCAPKIMKHSYKNSQDLERDKYDCLQVSTQLAANMGIPGNYFFIADEMNRCLKIKHGWYEAQ